MWAVKPIHSMPKKLSKGVEEGRKKKKKKKKNPFVPVSSSHAALYFLCLVLKANLQVLILVLEKCILSNFMYL